MKKLYVSALTASANLRTALRISFLFFGMMIGMVNGAMGQNTLIPSSGSNTMTYSGSLCTHAGCQVTYANNVNGYTVLNAAGSYIINIYGSYSTETNYDFIKIYNGSGTGG